MNPQKIPKQLYKERTAPYRAWLNTISIPIGLIVLFIAVFLGLTINAAGMLIFVFAIITHIAYRRIKAPKICHVAPILYYIYNGISIIYLMDRIAHPQGSIFTGILYLLSSAFLILVIVFYFVAAEALKKRFPSMREDYDQATIAYRAKK